MRRKYLYISVLSAVLLMLLSVLLVIRKQVNDDKNFFKEKKALNFPIRKFNAFFQPSFHPLPISVESILSIDHSWTATISAEKIRVLNTTGDVIPARSVNFQTTKRNNFVWAYEKTADFLRNADITLINLETPLISNCALTQEGMKFCGNARNIEGLVYAGIDIANLANNHVGNYGTLGIDETTNALNNAGISVTGSEEPAYIEINNIKFAFLGYNDIGGSEPKISWADEEKIKSDIHDAKQKADIIVVAYHWGVEYTVMPTKRQIDLAKLSIDEGADLIVGNHPHWIQPIAVYKNKLIIFAHGNFVFDQEWSQKTKEGIVARLVFYEKELIDTEILPIEIKDFGQPYFLEGEKKQKIISELRDESLRFAAFGFN